MRLNDDASADRGAAIHHRDVSIYLDEAPTSDTNGLLFFYTKEYVGTLSRYIM
jgi:hypothetical protein